jgi:hypothetical protein
MSEIETEKKTRRSRKSAEAQDEMTTPAHENRVKEAARKEKSKAPSPILDSWYEWVPYSADKKKGKKLVKKERTEGGVSSTYVGWEKKIPESFLKQIRGQIRPSKAEL